MLSSTASRHFLLVPMFSSAPWSQDVLHHVVTVACIQYRRFLPNPFRFSFLCYEMNESVRTCSPFTLFPLGKGGFSVNIMMTHLSPLRLRMLRHFLYAPYTPSCDHIHLCLLFGCSVNTFAIDIYVPRGNLQIFGPKRDEDCTMRSSITCMLHKMLLG
jgi:hypothetical protein